MNKTKKTWLAAVLNFFFMGAGYLYNGNRKGLGIGLTVASFGLTFVEFGIQPLDMKLYGIMFATVLLANAFLAIDAFQEAKMINQSSPQPS